MIRSWIVIGFTFIWILLSFTIAHGQEVTKYPTSLNGSDWNDFKEQTESLFNISYFIQNDSLPNTQIQFSSDGMKLTDVLNSNFGSSNFKVSSDGYGSFFITKGVGIRTKLPEGFF